METKIIPFSMGFTIDTNGTVFDTNGNIRNTYHNGDGYVTVSIKRDDGYWVTYGVHRLLALTFLSEERNILDTQVNHRDRNIINNSLSNLEWVTASENNIHSEIMRKDNNYATLYSTIKGTARSLYKNAHEASVATNINVLDIWDSIKDNKEINGMLFHHRDYDGKIPLFLQKTRTFLRGPNGERVSRPVKMLDFMSGEILHFNSIHAAAEFFNTGPSHIHQAIPIKETPRVFRKKYQIAYADMDFPELTKDEIDKAISHGSKEVIAFNTKENAYYIYSSAKEFIEANKLSKKSVTTCLADSKLKEIDNWIAVYSSTENKKRLKEFVTVPAVS